MTRWQELLVPQARLAGADLRGIYGSGFDLTDADLQGADLSGSHFSEGWLGAGEIHTKHHLANQLYGSDFSGANLSHADLSNANLSGCDFSGANLSGAILNGADLTRARLYGANLTSASLVGTQMSGANLTNAKLADARLDGADLMAYRDPPPDGNSAKYEGVRDIPAATVTGADFRGVNLSAAKTEGVDFSGCFGLDRSHEHDVTKRSK